MILTDDNMNVFNNTHVLLWSGRQLCVLWCTWAIGITVTHSKLDTDTMYRNTFCAFLVSATCSLIVWHFLRMTLWIRKCENQYILAVPWYIILTGTNSQFQSKHYNTSNYIELHLPSEFSMLDEKKYRKICCVMFLFLVSNILILIRVNPFS